MATGSRVTANGLQGARPDRDATVGVAVGTGPKKNRRGEQAMVPDATFTSYYGLPVINQPVWKAPDIPGYFFCGGLAGTASVIAAVADLTGRPALARAAKVGSAGAVLVGMVGLVHDLGRPARALNMLRVFKPTSPMSVGTWLLSAYTPAAVVAAATAVTHRFRPLGALATGAAALLGPAVASYTGALVADTAVPAWHDAHREMPYLFVASGAVAAAGLAMFAAPTQESAPARRVAVVAATADIACSRLIEQRLGMVGEPYATGTGGKYMQAARALTGGGALGAALSGRSRALSRTAGLALVAGSFCTKMGVFEAGLTSANDPRYTVQPQRERLEQAERAPEPSAPDRGAP
ncbi:MAG TPA: NrfD/PsrC family molybdoenzyme membrane anchor subunit [Acidimicrobiia bacterium]|jgi:formate-dependent nitrite reductase membrane component NrfD